MTYNRERHHRRSIRLPGYDYAQAGAYFITICTKARLCQFGDIVAGRMVLSPFGEIVMHEWQRSAVIRAELALDVFVVMPNHLHGIVMILEDARQGADVVGAHGRAPLPGSPLHRPPRSVGSFIAGFKAAASRRINALDQTPGHAVWQRNYYEHIIRSEAELSRIRQYISENPARWSEDPENPTVVDAVREPALTYTST